MFEDNFEHDFEKKENIFPFNLLYFLEKSLSDGILKLASIVISNPISISTPIQWKILKPEMKRTSNERGFFSRQRRMTCHYP